MDESEKLELEKLLGGSDFSNRLHNLSLMEEQLKTLLAEGFKKAVMEGSRESIERMLKAFDKFQQGSSMLEEAKKLTKLGSLVVGDQGQKDFGPFRLVWKVEMDHIEWSLNEIEDPQESWLTGALKYKGWNRIEIGSEIPEEVQIQAIQQRSSAGIRTAPPCFQIYVHQWPAFKEAMDFLYYDLGRKSAKGTYEDSFIRPETEDEYMKAI